MRTLVATTLSLLLLLLALPSVAGAQAVDGGVRGRVVDEEGSPVAGATVTASGPTLLGLRTAASDAEGLFAVRGLPVGPTTLRIERLGHRTLVLREVQVGLGRMTELGVVELPVSAVEMRPLVVDAGPLGPSPGLGSTLSREEVARLPLGRDYKTVVKVLPHADESFLGDPVNVAGSTGLENAWFIEGVNVTDIYRGRTGTELPSNFIEAVEVKQGGYEAEFGAALGGIVNVVTRSGTDDLRGEVFGFVSGSDLSAEARPIPRTLRQRSFTDVDAGASLSGPLVRDRAAFFVAYNPRVARARVVLPGLPAEEAETTRHIFAGKVDWRITPDMDVTGTVFGDPAVERRVNPAPGVTLLNADPILSSHREGGVNAALRVRARMSRTTSLEFALSRHGREEDAEGATDLGRREPAFVDRTDLPRVVLSGGNATDQEISSSRTAFRATGTTERGRHLLKAGVEVQWNRLAVSNREDPGQIALLPGDVYRSIYFLQDFTVENRVVSAFLQDEWSPSPEWTVNLGVRWDGQYLLDQTGDVAQSISDQLQPRLGVTYRPGEGRTRIFGHAGRFYQQLALFWSTIGLAGFDQRQVFSGVDPRVDPSAVDSVLVISDPDEIRGGTEGLRGEHHDEVVLGMEHRLSGGWTLGVRGIHRRLRESVTAAFRPDGTFVGGNPGRGDLDHLPASRRRYWGLDLTAGFEGDRHRVRASYVLARNEGNYPGLYLAEAGGLRGGSFGPNNSQSTYFPAQAVNSDGPLPNDRRHMLKLATSHDLSRRVTVGSFLTVGSGTPLSELGRVTNGFNAPLFLEPRGSAGRTPTVWDLSLRAAVEAFPGGRVILDLRHLGNPQETVNVDQRRFNGATGSPFASWETLVANQRGERPGYLAPIGFQPPFQLRLGLEMAF